MNERHFRLYERIVAIEDSLEALGPIDKLIERIEELEKMVKQTKPRGKMLYFNREEIDKWLLQNKQEVIGMVTKIEIDNPKE